MSDPLTDPPGDPWQVAATARGLAQVAEELGRTENDARTGVAVATVEWHGPRALEFGNAAPHVAARVGTAAGALAHAARVIGDYAEALTQAKDGMAECRRKALEAPEGDWAERAAEIRKDLRDTAGRTAGTLAQVGADLTAGAPRAGSGDRVVAMGEAQAWDLLMGSFRFPAGFGSDPAAAAAFWDALSEDERNDLVERYPAVVGATDGVPALYRDRANQSRIDELQAELQRRIDTHRAAEPDASPDHETRGPDGPSAAWRGWKEEQDQLEFTARRLQKLEDRLRELNHPPLFLLGLDIEGDGHAIVAQGNPDTATDTATFVSGVGSRLAVLPHSLDHANVMYDQAKAAGSEAPSIITWFGYDAPQSLGAGMDNGYAEEAAPALRRFQEGLRETHQGEPSHQTVIGFSYGSTVTGQAASHGESLEADSIAFVASPGVTVNRAEDLSFTGAAEDVYATVAQSDPINLGAGLNGPAPTGPSFGAKEFSSDAKPGAWYLGWNGKAHDGYWTGANPDTPNEAARNLGLIIAGHGDQVT